MKDCCWPAEHGSIHTFMNSSTYCWEVIQSLVLHPVAGDNFSFLVKLLQTSLILVVLFSAETNVETYNTRLCEEVASSGLLA